MLKHVLRLIFVLFFTFPFFSCDMLKEKSEKTSPKPTRVSKFQIIDNQTNIPISLAFIRLSIDKNQNGIIEDSEIKNITADENGIFEAQDTIEYKRVLKIDAPGYIPLVKTFNQNEKMDRVFYLQKITSSKEVQIKKTSSEFISKTNNIEVIIPSYSKAFPKAQSVSKVEIGYISPGKNTELMPANFKAYWDGPAYLSSTGAFYVRFYDEKGWPTELPEGEYIIKIKISPEDYSGISDFNFLTPEIEIPLWYLDEKEGLWEKAKELGYLVDENGNKVTKNNLSKLIEEGKNLYVIGKVKHFSFINCDIPTKPAAICGRLKGIDNCKNTYIEITGVNWNGGQGGNKATENCYFCVPVPHNLRKVFPKLKDCDKEMIKAYLNWGDDIINLIKNRNLAEKCEKQWENVANILKDYGYRLYEYLNLLSNSKGLSETDRDSIRKTANKFKELIDEGRFNEAFKYFENVHKIYVSNEKISAEDFEKVIKETQEKILEDVIKGFGDILGIDVNIPIATGSPLEISNFKLGDFFQAVAKYGSLENPCLRPVFHAVGEVAPGEITDYLAQISKGPIQLPSSDKILGATIKFVGSLLKNMIDEQTGGLNQNFLKCLEQDKNLAKFAKAFEATDLSKALADKLGTALIYANIVATGIQIGFDIYDANVEIKKKELASKWDSANYLVIRALSRATNSIEPECRPDNFIDLLSSPLNYVDLEALSNTCSNLKSFIENYQNFVKNIDNKEITGILELKETVEAIDGLYTLNTMLNAVTGGKGFYNKWFNYDNLELEEELPPVPGNFEEFGGYLSQLNISIPDMGIYKLPINGLSSEGVPLDLIPSPKVPAETPSGIIGAWIGDINLAESLTLTEVLLKFSFELPKNIEINKVSSFYIKNKHLLNPTNNNCWIEDKNIFCKFSTSEAVLNTPTDINISVSFNGRNLIQNTLLFQLKNVNISSSREFNFKVYLCDFYRIKSITVPEVIEPNLTYTFSAEIEKSKSLSKSECSQINSNPSITWYVGSLKIGNGNPINVKMPSREQMFYLGKINNIYAELKDELHSERKSQKVDIHLVNTKPAIISFNVPEKITAQQENLEVKAEVKDKDGDDIKLRWYTFPLSIISVEDGLNNKVAKIKVKHGNKDIKGRICLKASDFASSTTKCSEVTIEKKKIPPKILSIDKVVDTYIVPTTVHFKVKYASYTPVKKVNVRIYGPDGVKNQSYKSTEFDIKFNTSGDYTLNFQLVDSEDNTSNDMDINLHFYNLGTVNLVGSGSIISYLEENNLMEVKLFLSGVSNLTVLKYKWDLNLDGIYDIITYTPEITFKVSPKNPINKVNVQLETPLGPINFDIPAEKVEPLVVINGDKNSGTSPLTVNFNVNVYSIGLKPEKYKFDFDGDGTFDLITTESTASYIYENPGTYECYVEVLFSDGSKKGAIYEVTVNYEGLLSIYELEYPAYGKLEYIGDKLIAHFKSGIPPTGYLSEFYIADGIYLNKAETVLKGFISDVNLSPLSDGYLILENGSICTNPECLKKESGTCLLKFDFNENISWKKCFPGNYNSLSISGDLGLVYAHNNYPFIKISLSDGNILSLNELEYNGKRKSISYLYSDSEYFYVSFVENKRIILAKISTEDMSIIKAKSIYLGETYISPVIISADESYVYVLIDYLVTTGKHAYILWVVNKDNFEDIYVKEVLYECPYYCYKIADFEVDDESIYLLGSYYYWSGDGQRIIKLNKYSGDFIFVRKLRVCKSDRCSDDAQSITIKDSWIYTLGSIDESRGVKGFYISALTKNGSGCNEYVGSLDPEDIGFNKLKISYTTNTVDTSSIVIKEKEINTFEPYIDIQDITSEIIEYDSCR